MQHPPADRVEVSTRGAHATLVATTRLDHPVEDVFSFFADARNLEAITPPSLRFQIASDVGDGSCVEGMLIDYRLRLRGVPMGWRTQIARYDPPHAFVDVQLRGPYRTWIHEHRFERMDDGTTLMTDIVRLRPRGPAPLAVLALRLFVAREVRAIFVHRGATIRELLAGRESLAR